MHRISTLFIASVLLLLPACQAGHRDRSETTSQSHLNMHFDNLEVGAIKPRGWLLDWSNTAADGITGHLDERATTFEKGWSGETFEARGVKEEGTHWPLEQSAYWLDGLVRLAYILDDAALIAKAKSRLDPIVEGVLQGGPSFIYWRSIDQLQEGFDNWAHSHMGRALVAYYSATGDSRILEALVKVYRSYRFPENVRFSFGGVSGMTNMDPLLNTYRFSGDNKVYGKAMEFAGRNDYRKLVEAWSRQNLEEGHGVIFYENIRVPALVYALTGERQHLEASRNALKWAEDKYLMPYGLISSEEWMAGKGSTRNTETCNLAAGAWTLYWLTKITGIPAYADRAEQVFFNAGPVPVDRDFQTMCYYQCPNRISMEFPEDEPPHPGAGCYRYTPTGHSVLCCVGNLNRVIPNYILHMWMKPVSGGLAAVHYGPCEINTRVKDTKLTITCLTAYPFDENIELSIHTGQKTSFPLHLRIPGWCKEAEIRVNGRKPDIKMKRLGYAVIERTWSSGDKVQIRFPMPVRLTQGRETPVPDIPYFQERKHYWGKQDSLRRIYQPGRNTGNPYACISRGPLLFAYPIPDQGPNDPRQDYPYQFAINLNPEAVDDKVTIHQQPLRRPWKWEINNAPVSLKVPARSIDWSPEALQPLPSRPVRGGKDTLIRLIPYNMTRFRVSMFPVTASSW